MGGLIARLAGKAWVHVAVAFVAMGAWAYHANRFHPMPEPARAALVQGALSGAITYGLKRVLDALRGRFAPRQGGWLPPVLACSGSLCLLVGAHGLAGTPELARTIALPFGVATVYAVTYNMLMWKKGQRP